MNPIDRRLRPDLVAARYLAALERDDFTEMADIWRLALADAELEAILREVHAGLIEEQADEATAAVGASVTAAVEAHLPSAEIVRFPAGPVTVGEVAEELFRHTPDRLPAEAHLLNERLPHVAGIAARRPGAIRSDRLGREAIRCSGGRILDSVPAGGGEARTSAWGGS